MNSVMSRSVAAQRFAPIRPAAQADIIDQMSAEQAQIAAQRFCQFVRSHRVPPAAQTLPPGIPTGTIVQQGSSITPQFIAAVVGVLIIVGGLAYYLTRSAPESLGTRERRVRRNRNPRVRTPMIAVTYDIVTPESAEQGDYAESGWIDEEGQDMTPDSYDREEGITAVDKAVKFLKYEGAREPSTSHFHPGVWYINDEHDTDYRTGAVESRSYHLRNFSQHQEREIFNRMKRR